MGLDAAVIADTGQDGLSKPNALNSPSLGLDGRSTALQEVFNDLDHQGHIVTTIENNGAETWWWAPRYKGLFLLSHLTKHGFEA